MIRNLSELNKKVRDDRPLLGNDPLNKPLRVVADGIVIDIRSFDLIVKSDMVVLDVIEHRTLGVVAGATIDEEEIREENKEQPETPVITQEQIQSEFKK
jgi:hypothetical protein